MESVKLQTQKNWKIINKIKSVVLKKTQAIEYPSEEYREILKEI